MKAMTKEEIRDVIQKTAWKIPYESAQHYNIHYGIFHDQVAQALFDAQKDISLDTILSLLPKEKKSKFSEERPIIEDGKNIGAYNDIIVDEYSKGWNAYKKQAEENVRRGLK